MRFAVRMTTAMGRSGQDAAATLCCPCGRTVASPHLGAAELRALTGFTFVDGLDVCRPCAAELATQPAPGR